MHNRIQERRISWSILLIACLTLCSVSISSFAIAVPDPTDPFKPAEDLVTGEAEALPFDHRPTFVGFGYRLSSSSDDDYDPEEKAAYEACQGPEPNELVLYWIIYNTSFDHFELQYVDSDYFSEDWKMVVKFSAEEPQGCYLDQKYLRERKRYYRVVAMDGGNIVAKSRVLSIYWRQDYYTRYKTVTSSKDKVGWHGFVDNETVYKKSVTTKSCGAGDTRYKTYEWKRDDDENEKRDDDENEYFKHEDPDGREWGGTLMGEDHCDGLINTDKTQTTYTAFYRGNDDDEDGQSDGNGSITTTLSDEFTDAKLREWINEDLPPLTAAKWSDATRSLFGLESENTIRGKHGEIEEHAFQITPIYPSEPTTLRWVEAHYDEDRELVSAKRYTRNIFPNDSNTTPDIEQEKFEKYYTQNGFVDQFLRVDAYDWHVTVSDFRGTLDRYEPARIYLNGSGTLSRSKGLHSKKVTVTPRVPTVKPLETSTPYSQWPEALKLHTKISWSDVLQVKGYNPNTDKVEIFSGQKEQEEALFSVTLPGKLINRAYTVTARSSAKTNKTALVKVTTTDGNGNLVAEKEITILLIVDDPNFYNIPLHDATGPKYRKISLNGRPLTDEKPQAASESDETKEQTYVDAFSLNLVHSVTDIYQPIPGSELSFSVRRNAQPEIWNLRSGLRPHEQPARPFGSGWSTNLTSYIKFTQPKASDNDNVEVEEPITAEVVDENGNLHRFVKHTSDFAVNDWVPMPSAHEAKAYLTTLTITAPGEFKFERKHGNTLLFDITDIEKWVPRDRLGYSETDTYNYARLRVVEDRLRYRLVYHYLDDQVVSTDGTTRVYHSLIPSEVTAQRWDDNTSAHVDILGQQLYIQRDGKRRLITAVWDSNGNKIRYGYNYDEGKDSFEEKNSFTPKTLGYPQYYHLLTDVFAPEDGHTKYKYSSTEIDDHDEHTPLIEPDMMPPKTEDWVAANTYHINLTRITDALDHTYEFSYVFDHSKEIRSSLGCYVPQSGNPRYITTVTLPNKEQVHFKNLNNEPVDYDDLCRDSNNDRLRIEFTADGVVDKTFERQTEVIDAEDSTTKYAFSGTKVVVLDTFKKSFVSIGRLTSTRFKDPRLLYYTTMTVTHGDKGSEIFTFEPNAGLALSRVQDINGHKTTFHYDNTWISDDDHFYHTVWPEQLNFAHYDDPTSQINALGYVKTFEYDSDHRIMSKVIDEEGRTREYEIDEFGRRLDERIYDRGYNLVQQITFKYDAKFPGVVTNETVKDLHGASSDIITAYTTDDNGRIADVTTYPGFDASGKAVPPLKTSYTYDWNNNRISDKDPEDKITVFEYDRRNRLNKITYHDGTFSEIAYDLRGRKVREVDENGHATLYEYDALNRLTKQSRDMNRNLLIDDGDLTTQYGYNKVNSRTSETDPMGYTTYFSYDSLQRLEEITDAKDFITEFRYGENSGHSAFDVSGFKPTWTKDPRGYVTEVDYDPLYRPVETRVEYERGRFAKAVNKYDNVGNLTMVIDPLNKKTSTVYDALNRPTKVTYGDDNSTETTYTSTGLTWKVTDENGNTTETHYDGAGRPIRVIGPALKDQIGRSFTKTYYDQAGNVEKTWYSRSIFHGHVWEYGYDDRHRRVRETSPSVWDEEKGTSRKLVVETEYDNVGNVIAVTDARGHRTVTKYDDANRPTLVIYPRVTLADGNYSLDRLSTSYDKNGNVVNVYQGRLFGPSRRSAHNEYDKLNRLKSTTDAENIKVSYEYDEVGNRIKVTDGKKQTTEFSYDGLNRLTLTKDPAGRTSSLIYDAVNQTARRDSNNRWTGYDYDGRHRLSQVSYDYNIFTGAPPSQTRTYAYDDAGNVLSVTEPDNSKADVFYTYDALNRIDTETSGGLTHSYTYDLVGNRTKTTYGGTGRKLVSRYDALNRLESLSDGNRVTTYAYDGNGNIVKKTLPNGQVIRNIYDELNRVIRSDGLQANGDVQYSYVMKYDPFGNVHEISESYSGKIADRTVINTYDDIDRLVEEKIVYTDGTSDVITTYVYDDAHNRTSMKISDGAEAGRTNYDYNELNQLASYTKPSGEVFTFTYDKNGNRIEKINETTGATQTYAYDRENRLIRVDGDVTRAINIYPGTRPNASGIQAHYTESGNVYEYTYDYRTRRVERKEPNSPATKVVFSGGLSVQEYHQGESTPPVEYIRGSDYGGGIGGVLYTLREGVPSYNHYNNRGDVTAKTDATGVLTYQAAYEAFGTHGPNDARTQEWGNTEDRQKANTKDEDPTGLLNEGFRYRDLETGTFITRDPLGFVDGPNMYTYVVQNPWTKFDPLGLEASIFKRYRLSWSWPQFRQNSKDMAGGAWAGTSKGMIGTANFVGQVVTLPIAGTEGGKTFRQELNNQSQKMQDSVDQTVTEVTGADPNSSGFAITNSAGETAAPGLPTVSLSQILRNAKIAKAARLNEKQKHEIETGGAYRRKIYSEGWTQASLSEAIKRHAGENATTWTNKGKRIWENPQTGRQVVYDMDGDYFRIFQPDRIGGKEGRNLNLAGNEAATTFRAKGGQIKTRKLRSQDKDKYNQNTHFLNSDS